MTDAFRGLSQGQRPLLSAVCCGVLAVVMLIIPSVSGADQQNSSGDGAIVIAQAKTQSDGRAMVNLMNQVEGLNRSLSKLRGKIEELGNGIENAEQRQKDMYLDLDTRLRRIEQASAESAQRSKKTSELMSTLQERIDRLEQSAVASTTSSPPEAGNATQANAATPAGANSVNSAVKRAYIDAWEKYKAGEYQDAIDAFQVIVNKYPTHPLAVNAQYWTGASYYKLRAFRSAIDAQKLLLSSYPDSEKAPDALFTMGRSYLGLGDAGSARQSWEQLIATYPGSRAASKASGQLERLP